MCGFSSPVIESLCKFSSDRRPRFLSAALLFWVALSPVLWAAQGETAEMKLRVALPCCQSREEVKLLLETDERISTIVDIVEDRPDVSILDESGGLNVQRSETHQVLLSLSPAEKEWKSRLKETLLKEATRLYLLQLAKSGGALSLEVTPGTYEGKGARTGDPGHFVPAHLTEDEQAELRALSRDSRLEQLPRFCQLARERRGETGSTLMSIDQREHLLVEVKNSGASKLTPCVVHIGSDLTVNLAYPKSYHKKKSLGPGENLYFPMAPENERTKTGEALIEELVLIGTDQPLDWEHLLSASTSNDRGPTKTVKKKIKGPAGELTKGANRPRRRSPAYHDGEVTQLVGTLVRLRLRN